MAGTVDGIVSGINTTELIGKLMDVARAPIKQMESKQSTLNIRKFAFQDLNSLLGSLQTALEAVDTEAEFGAYAATSTISTGVTATITGAATPGTHDVAVSNLAQSELHQSSGFATASAALTGTSIDVRVGDPSNSTTTTVNIDASIGTTTLSGLASYLNDSVAGVKAWVMNTGAASDPYVLMVEGADTGTANAVDLSVNGVTGLSFTNARDAENASFTVDGIAISSGSNSVSDVLPGVTLNLLNESFGTSKVAINRDSSAMADKVDSIVAAYNNLDKFFDSQTGKAAGAVLSGDSTVRQVQQKVTSTVTQDYAQGTLSGLAALGLSTDKTGKMSFSSATFTSALGTNYSDVMSSLTGTDGFFGKLQSALDVITDTTTGVVEARIKSIDTQMTDLTDRIADAEVRLATYHDMLKNQFTNMELMLGRYQGTQKYLEQQIAQWTKQK
tara:strand:+ start:846 stop:2180 length:1335 start_codon:yes stop_codon:yes gene_type:complete